MTTKILRRTGLIELAGADVPSLMLRPDVDTPVPGVLLLHGYSSTKEVLSDTMGVALAARGVATLSFDLPLHGHRDDEMFEEAKTNPFGLLQHWKSALVESKGAIEWLASHEAIDEDRLGVLGYSLGSYVGLQTAASEKRVKCVVVAAGGDLPETPWTSMVRMVTDPLTAAKLLKTRPLLVLHGTNDRTIRRQQAQTLYDAALEPKELKWYESGHVLPPAAADDAASWMVAQLG
ncbi:MAG TPA: alpha/beta fold hydrolase [Gemmatimonadaceae bacterium]|nr:alpha/beta fold hydrolase [Gemmatimonadaceae bacterium]